MKDILPLVIMSNNREKVTIINIMGQDYPIKGDVDPIYLKRIATELNERLLAVESRMTIKMSGKTAVLTALNLMDDFDTLRSQKKEFTKNLNQRINSIIAKINRTLEKK